LDLPGVRRCQDGLYGERIAQRSSMPDLCWGVPRESFGYKRQQYSRKCRNTGNAAEMSKGIYKQNEGRQEW